LERGSALSEKFRQYQSFSCGERTSSSCSRLDSRGGCPHMGTWDERPSNTSQNKVNIQGGRPRRAFPAVSPRCHWHYGFGLPTFVALRAGRTYNFWNCHSSAKRIVTCGLGREFADQKLTSNSESRQGAFVRRESDVGRSSPGSRAAETAGWGDEAFIRARADSAVPNNGDEGTPHVRGHRHAAHPPEPRAQYFS
jgi:hypothetical protein